ncbi:MAG: monovalent cation/H+ antiporter subunit B [Gammaproteobacteria bacterium BRH_c0]|nr:MAG: monovalent cation/H+ antiporter subunit B [Gammaproteobacteria bacterium BRH_c0]
MTRDPVLKITAKFLIPLIMLFALYVQFHGEYSPGGGFQAGVIFASAIILYGLVFGVEAASAVLPMSFLIRQAAAGVLLYGGVGVVSMLLGGQFLNYNLLAADPVSGQHLGIILVELGVGLTVTAVMVIIFFVFADRNRP